MKRPRCGHCVHAIELLLLAGGIGLFGAHPVAAAEQVPAAESGVAQGPDAAPQQVAEAPTTDAEPGAAAAPARSAHAPRVVAVLPARWSGRELEVSLNSTVQLSLVLEDEDGDALQVTPLGLPEGATFDDATRTFRWTPRVVGESIVRFVVSDGGRETSHSVYLHAIQPAPPTLAPKPDSVPPLVVAREEWESFLLPGVGYSGYFPRGNGLDAFHGVAIELVVVSWIHRNDNRGPSHGRVYASSELLRDPGGGPLLFAYGFGTSLSFERNPTRSWLIPYYGIEFGGLVSKPLGGHFQTTPHLGLHAYASPNLFVNLRVGYRLVPGEMDRLGGLQLGGTVNFSVW